MDKVPLSLINSSIDCVIEILSDSCGIKGLYPHQRKMLQEFCHGKDIFHTGRLNKTTKFIVNKIHHNLRKYQFRENITTMFVPISGGRPEYQTRVGIDCLTEVFDANCAQQYQRESLPEYQIFGP